MNYLLYNKGSFLSARLLATLLGLKPTSNIDKIKDGKVIIRYGNSFGNFDQDTIINSAEAIKICSDSVKFSQWCKDNGFNTPEYLPFKFTETITYPFLLRKKYHKQGKDIIFVKSPDELNNLDDFKGKLYHVPYIEADIELGIHLVNQKVVKLFKKILNEENSTIIKNQDSCHYHIINNLEENFQYAQELCENLFKKIGLNFGRVDIAYNSINKRYIIWEVNTAPGLNKFTGDLYAKVLREIIDVQ